MAGLNIDGDISNITEKQLNFVKSVIEKKGFNNAKVVVEPVGKVGDNYMADVKRITVEGEKGGSLKMVAKFAPGNPIQRTMGNTEFVFKNEHVMYTKVLPKFTQLEKNYEVPVQDRLIYPLCYGSSDDAPNEVLILEDLGESNFKMLNRFENLNNDCLKSFLRNLALLHALSFTLKYKEADQYEELKNSLYDLWSSEALQELSSKMLPVMEANILGVLENNYHKKALQGVLRNIFANFAKMSKIDANSKHSVIQHGDAWTNNIMFKYDGEQLTDSVLIDYQICKSANPVTDILFTISICTSYEQRKENFYDWVDYYHSELDKSLSNFGLKSNYVYSKDQMDSDLKRYGKVVLGHCTFMMGMMALKTDDAAMMKKAMQSADEKELMKHTGAATSEDPETVALFRTKLEGLIDSFHDFGLL